MSQPSYIYVAIGVASREPVATFTVKKQFVAWLRTLQHPELFTYWRQRNGCTLPYKPVRLDWRVLVDSS